MDLGYSDFIKQLQYKSLYNNKIFIQADKWFASSKTCSVCGFVNKNLLLSDRKWDCPNCGQSLNRDQNAGQNLKTYALKELDLVPQELREFKPVEKENRLTQSKNCVKVSSVKQEAQPSLAVE